MTTRKLLFFAALLGALITYTLAHAALVPKAECKVQCGPSIAVECLQRHGQVLRVKPACRARLIRQCRHHKDACTTTTTTTSTSTTTTTTTTTSTTTTTAGPECPATGCLRTLDFVNGLAGGNCGTVEDGAGTPLRNLTCGGLNIGGGRSNVAEGPTPDGSTSRFTLVCAAPDGGVCSIVPSPTAPAPNSADPDCTATGCNFGTPLPIPNPVLRNLTTCVHNTWATDATGSVDLDTGASVTAVPLASDTYVTSNFDQPCPACRNGVCDRGINAGLACTSVNSSGYTRDCPVGGVSPGHVCEAGGTGTCADGSAHVGPLKVTLSPLGTDDAVKHADANGNFCPGQGVGQTGLPGCFNLPDCRTIIETGQPAGPITASGVATARLASVFCIPPSGNGLVDISADLPGPGAVTLPGTFTVR